MLKILHDFNFLNIWSWGWKEVISYHHLHLPSSPSFFLVLTPRYTKESSFIGKQSDSVLQKILNFFYPLKHPRKWLKDIVKVDHLQFHLKFLFSFALYLSDFLSFRTYTHFKLINYVGEVPYFFHNSSSRKKKKYFKNHVIVFICVKSSDFDEMTIFTGLCLRTTWLVRCQPLLGIWLSCNPCKISDKLIWSSDFLKHLWFLCCPHHI